LLDSFFKADRGRGKIQFLDEGHLTTNSLAAVIRMDVTVYQTGKTVLPFASMNPRARPMTGRNFSLRTTGFLSRERERFGRG